MKKITCPVKTCKGFDTTSGSFNLVNHIKNKAKSELLTNFILGRNSIDHAKFLKESIRTETVNVMKINGKTYLLKNE